MVSLFVMGMCETFESFDTADEAHGRSKHKMQMHLTDCLGITTLWA